MNELQVVRRKLKLARQGLLLSRIQVDELIMRYALLKIKLRIEQQISEKFDPVLSRRLDCINYLLEN